MGYSLFVFPTATFLCPRGHSYLAKLTRRVRWTLAIGDEHRSQSMHSTTGERRPRKAQLFNFSALARATRARAPPPRPWRASIPWRVPLRAFQKKHKHFPRAIHAWHHKHFC